MFSFQWSSLVFVWFWSRYGGRRRHISSFALSLIAFCTKGGKLLKLFRSGVGKVEFVSEESLGFIVESMFHLVRE